MSEKKTYVPSNLEGINVTKIEVELGATIGIGQYENLRPLYRYHIDVLEGQDVKKVQREVMKNGFEEVTALYKKVKQTFKEGN